MAIGSVKLIGMNRVFAVLFSIFFVSTGALAQEILSSQLHQVRNPDPLLGDIRVIEISKTAAAPIFLTETSPGSDIFFGARSSLLTYSKKDIVNGVNKFFSAKENDLSILVPSLLSGYPDINSNIFLMSVKKSGVEIFEHLLSNGHICEPCSPESVEIPRNGKNILSFKLLLGSESKGIRANTLLTNVLDLALIMSDRDFHKIFPGMPVVAETKSGPRLMGMISYIPDSGKFVVLNDVFTLPIDLTFISLDGLLRLEFVSLHDSKIGIAGDRKGGGGGRRL